MMSPEKAFRSAVEARDLPRAEAAFRDYVDWFRSGQRTLEDVESSKRLVEWALNASISHRIQIAEQLMLLKRIASAYLPQSFKPTWRVIG